MKKADYIQKGLGVVEVIIVLVFAGLIGFAGWYVWNSKKGDGTSKKAGTSNIPRGEADVPEGWRKYSNEDLSLGFNYPSEWGEVKFAKTYAVTPDKSKESGDFYTLKFSGKVNGGNREAKIDIFGRDWKLENWSTEVPRRIYPMSRPSLDDFFLSPDTSFKETAEYKIIYEDQNTDMVAGIDRLSSGIYISIVQAVNTKVSDGLQMEYIIDPDPEPYPSEPTDPKTLFSKKEIDTLTKVTNSFKTL